MKKDMIDSIEVEMGSGNVFSDMGLSNANQLKIKSGLVIEMTKAIRQVGLTLCEAARRMCITQAKVSSMLRGDFSNPFCVKRIGSRFYLDVSSDFGMT